MRSSGTGFPERHDLWQTLADEVLADVSPPRKKEKSGYVIQLWARDWRSASGRRFMVSVLAGHNPLILRDIWNTCTAYEIAEAYKHSLVDSDYAWDEK